MKEESNALVIGGQVGDARGSGLRGVRVIAIEATGRERADAALLRTDTTGPEGNFELHLTMAGLHAALATFDTARPPVGTWTVTAEGMDTASLDDAFLVLVYGTAPAGAEG